MILPKEREPRERITSGPNDSHPEARNFASQRLFPICSKPRKRERDQGIGDKLVY